jgi:hypothetical protein
VKEREREREYIILEGEREGERKKREREKRRGERYIMERVCTTATEDVKEEEERALACSVRFKYLIYWYNIITYLVTDACPFHIR